MQRNTKPTTKLLQEPPIKGIEPLYQQIADSMEESIPEEWSTAWMYAIVYSSHYLYLAEYMTPSSTTPKSYATGRAARRGIESMREEFSRSGKPLWCQAVFVLQSDGKFNLKWGYDCGGDGFARWDDSEDDFARIEKMRKFRDQE